MVGKRFVGVGETIAVVEKGSAGKRAVRGNGLCWDGLCGESAVLLARASFARPECELPEVCDMSSLPWDLRRFFSENRVVCPHQVGIFKHFQRKWIHFHAWEMRRNKQLERFRSHDTDAQRSKMYS